MARLPSKLGPQAKKLVLVERERARARGADERAGRVHVTLRVAGAADRGALLETLGRLGATVRSSREDTGLVHAEVGTDALEAVAELDGVAYVEVGTPFMP